MTIHDKHFLARSKTRFFPRKDISTVDRKNIANPTRCIVPNDNPVLFSLYRFQIVLDGRRSSSELNSWNGIFRILFLCSFSISRVTPLFHIFSPWITPLPAVAITVAEINTLTLRMLFSLLLGFIYSDPKHCSRTLFKSFESSQADFVPTFLKIYLNEERRIILRKCLSLIRKMH